MACEYNKSIVLVHILVHDAAMLRMRRLSSQIRRGSGAFSKAGEKTRSVVSNLYDDYRIANRRTVTAIYRSMILPIMQSMFSILTF